MNIGGHIKANGLLTKNKHTRHLPQEGQVGGFPTITLIEEAPWKRIPWWRIPWWRRTPWGGGPPGPQGPAGPVRPIIVQMPQIILDTTALENTSDTVGQSMMQLSRAKDQTNR